jgi:hypothetical protein
MREKPPSMPEASMAVPMSELLRLAAGTIALR